MSTENDRAVEEYFAGSPLGLALYRAVAAAIATIGTAQIRVTKSQIAFRRRKGFAYVWRPDRVLRTDVPAVLSFPLPERLDSARFKSVVNPARNVWMHHIELRDVSQIDAQLRAWLTTAYEHAT